MSMPVTLYDAVIPSQIQILESVGNLLVKAESFCEESGLNPANIIDARLAPDMLPFAFQIRQVRTHSLGAIESVRQGSFTPDRSPTPTAFVDLTAIVTDAIDGLKMVDPEEMEAFIGREMRFSAGEMKFEFAGHDFLLSFSQPNFYFHATTAYDILRWKGLSIGKRDFSGRIRTKG
jgi:hypothetical protein